jgi:polysaccharide export outer membrane protein
VALLGLGVALGCQSPPNPATDAFATRTGADHAPRRLWSFMKPAPEAVAAAPAVPAAQAMPPVYAARGAAPGYPSYPAAYQPYVAYPTAAAAAEMPGVPVGTPSGAQPAVMLRPVPPGGGAGPAVIASSWSPVQPVGAEAPAGPDLGGDTGELARGLSLAMEAPGTDPVPVAISGQPVIDLPPAGAPAIATSTADQPPARKNDKDSGPARDSDLPAPRSLGPTPGAPGNGSPLPPGAHLMPGPGPYDGLAHGPLEGPPGGPHGGPHVPREFFKQALPPYVVEPPDMLLIEATEEISGKIQPLAGQHLVRPDGTISLGIHGTLFVAGMTIEQIKDAIAAALQAGPAKKYTIEAIKRELNVDVLSYNSKYYYIITDGGGYGAQVYRLLVTGNETVLDALAQVQGLPPVASKKKIWLARATPGDAAHPKIFPIDWCGLTERGSAATNYQVYPGDRIYVQSDVLIRTDTFLAKLFSPVLRSFGVTLLGATTVNTIKNGSSGGGGSGTGTR